MPDLICLDIVDHPAPGVVRSVRRLNAIRRAEVPGLRAVIPLATGPFAPRVIPEPTPRRIGVLTAWADGNAIDAAWAPTVGRVATGAREHWHVRGEMTRAGFSAPWKGWTPDLAGARPLDDDEPALILISGNLKAQFVPPFFRDAARVVRQAFGEEGYLGGLAVQSSPLNTTSCSAWRTYRDAIRYAYADGEHARAMKRDVEGEHHATEYFCRVRPLAERGTLAGAAPFAGVLGVPAAA